MLSKLFIKNNFKVSSNLFIYSRSFSSLPATNELEHIKITEKNPQWSPSSQSQLNLDDGIILSHVLNKPKKILSNPSEKKRETIVITHGVMGNLDNFSSWSKRLVSKLNDDYDVLLLDLRNHGRTYRKISTSSSSSYPEYSLSYPNIALDIAKTLDHLDIQDCHLIGHSLGGKSMATLGLLNDHFYQENLIKNKLNIRSLTVLDIGLIPYSLKNSRSLVGIVSILKKLEEVNEKIFLSLNNNNNEKKLSLKEARDIIKKSFVNKELGFFISLSLKLKDNINNNDNNNIEKFEWDFNLKQIVKDIESILSFIDPLHPILSNKNNSSNLSTLFLKGENSDFLNKENSSYINHFYPNSNIIEIKGATHWLHVEKQDETTDVISQFLNNLSENKKNI